MSRRQGRWEQQPLLMPPGPRERRPQSREVQALLDLLDGTPTSYSALTRTAQKRCARECERIGLVARGEFDRLHLTAMGRSVREFMHEHGAEGYSLRQIHRDARTNHERDAARDQGRDQE